MRVSQPVCACLLGEGQRAGGVWSIQAAEPLYVCMHACTHMPVCSDIQAPRSPAMAM